MHETVSHYKIDHAPDNWHPLRRSLQLLQSTSCPDLWQVYMSSLYNSNPTWPTLRSRTATKDKSRLLSSTSSPFLKLTGKQLFIINTGLVLLYFTTIPCLTESPPVFCSPLDMASHFQLCQALTANLPNVCCKSAAMLINVCFEDHQGSAKASFTSENMSTVIIEFYCNFEVISLNA